MPLLVFKAISRIYTHVRLVTTLGTVLEVQKRSAPFWRDSNQCENRFLCGEMGGTIYKFWSDIRNYIPSHYISVALRLVQLIRFLCYLVRQFESWSFWQNLFNFNFFRCNFLKNRGYHGEVHEPLQNPFGGPIRTKTVNFKPTQKPVFLILTNHIYFENKEHRQTVYFSN